MDWNYDGSYDTDPSSSPEPDDVRYVLTQPHVHTETKSEYTWPFQVIFAGRQWVSTTPILIENPEDEVTIQLLGALEPEGRYLSLGIEINSANKIPNAVSLEFVILFGPRPFQTSTKQFIISYTPNRSFWLNRRFVNLRMASYLFEMARLGNVRFSVKTVFNKDSDYLCHGRTICESYSCRLAKKRFKFSEFRNMKKRARSSKKITDFVKLPPISTIINAPGFDQLWSDKSTIARECLGVVHYPSTSHTYVPLRKTISNLYGYSHMSRLTNNVSQASDDIQFPSRLIGNTSTCLPRINHQMQQVPSPMLPTTHNKVAMPLHAPPTCAPPFSSTVNCTPPHCSLARTNISYMKNVTVRADDNLTRKRLIIFCEGHCLVSEAKMLEKASSVVRAFLDFCSPPIGYKGETYFILEGTTSSALNGLLAYLRSDIPYRASYLPHEVRELARKLQIKMIN